MTQKPANPTEKELQEARDAAQKENLSPLEVLDKRSSHPEAATLTHDAEPEKPAVKVKKTGLNTHTAIARGYAAGMLIEPGEFVPADIPVGEWMEKAKK